jgi:hypothetical protein
LARLGQHRTRTGKVITRLGQRRLVAVLGDIDALKPRVWLEAVRQSISTAPQVVWLSDQQSFSQVRVYIFEADGQ